MHLSPRKTLSLLALAALGVACAGRYDAPPRVDIAGLQDGVLSDVSAPLVLRFSKRVKPETVKVSIVKLELDLEGNLADEVAGPDPANPPQLAPLFAHDDSGDRFGTSAFIDDNRALEIRRLGFPIGTKLALIVEPGLATDDGAAATVARRRIPFAYNFKCKGTKGPGVLTSGSYFFVLDVESPVGTQLQLFTTLEVDPVTGLFRGQFTNADRSLDRSRCRTVSCAAVDACRTLPREECVAPSLRAGGPDEFPDYVVNNTPPTGYSFSVTGCAEDQGDGSSAFVTAPADVVVQQPAVSVTGLAMIAAFTKGTDGVLRATGGATGDKVLLAGNPLNGSAKGTARGRSLTPEQAPKDIPKPPAK